MSPLNRRNLPANGLMAFLALTVLGAGLVGGRVFAQEAPAAAGETPPATPPDLTPIPATVTRLTEKQVAAKLKAILHEVSGLRGLSIKKPVASGIKSPEEIRAFMEKSLRDEYGNRRLEAAEIYLQQLQLLPPGTTLKQSYTDLLVDQMGGFYDPRVGKFFVTDTVNAMMLDTIMAHELAHALQDQHFDLMKLKMQAKAKNSDAQMAVEALVEGDATWVMARYMTASPFRSFGAVLGSATVETEVTRKAPPVLMEALTFPYLEGNKFVTVIRSQNKVPLDRLFARVPQSTEQILHPEKYHANEAPILVKIPDVSGQLGKGWVRLDTDVNGEFGSYLNLGKHGSWLTRFNAAAGWGGDAYAIYRGPANKRLIVQDSQWDTVRDATEWLRAYSASATARMKSKARVSSGAQVWSDGKNGVWMKQQGKRVLILEGTVGAFTPQWLMTLHGMK